MREWWSNLSLSSSSTGTRTRTRTGTTTTAADAVRGPAKLVSSNLIYCLFVCLVCSFVRSLVWLSAVRFWSVLLLARSILWIVVFTVWDREFVFSSTQFGGPTLKSSSKSTPTMDEDHKISCFAFSSVYQWDTNTNEHTHTESTVHLLPIVHRIQI